MRGNAIHHRITVLQLVIASFFLSALAGCDDAGSFSLNDVFNAEPDAEAGSTSRTQEDQVSERDIEAPDVFSVSEAGLWDGRPSLGGVWVAHPDVTEPERVIIRNQANGQSVVGALFRRARDVPGPRLQMSSDAAEALGVLAGAPAELNVVALRKEVIAQPPNPSDQGASGGTSEITETPLDPVAVATAAPDAPGSSQADNGQTATRPAPSENQSNLPQSTPGKPYVQIGIFSEEANAERAAKQMRSAGLIPKVEKRETDGRPFWRVVVGPATTTAEQGELLNTTKGEGFTDAYAVTN
ncbi:MAG: SPOR domain-containing protein [Paracoccaceae bacterium]|nr:SPOR domain-containing protein [Paracoccaceae bacterium]